MTQRWERRGTDDDADASAAAAAAVERASICFTRGITSNWPGPHELADSVGALWPFCSARCREQLCVCILSGLREELLDSSILVAAIMSSLFESVSSLHGVLVV